MAKRRRCTSRARYTVLVAGAFGLGVAGYSVLTLAYAWADYPGIEIVGLIIGSGALTVDLEKEGGAGDPQTTYACHTAAQHPKSYAERAAHRTEIQSLARSILIAKTVSGTLVVIGFCGFYLFHSRDDHRSPSRAGEGKNSNVIPEAVKRRAMQRHCINASRWFVMDANPSRDGMQSRHSLQACKANQWRFCQMPSDGAMRRELISVAQEELAVRPGHI